MSEPQIPTRLTVDPQHEYYRNDPETQNIIQRVEVYLDGERKKTVVTLNQMEGWLEEYEVDANDQPVTKDGDWCIIRRHGKITLKLGDGT